MTDIMAAIGLAQLERYPNMLVRRKEIIAETPPLFNAVKKDDPKILNPAIR